jgi:hypothetical protein
MRIYYRSPSVLVTDRFVKVTGAAKRSVSIGRLDHVYVVDAATGLPRGFLLRRLWLAAIGMTIAVGVAVHNLIYGLSGPLLVSAIALVTCGAVLLAVPARARPVRELWAVIDHDGHVCLYSSTDRHEFGQVYRAVVRAIEHNA